MAKHKNVPPTYYGDEAPSVKDVLVVLFVILLLIVSSWFATQLGLLK